MSKKVIRGQIMLMRGHTLGAQLSFDMHHTYVPEH